MRVRRPSQSLNYCRRTALYRLFDTEGRLLYVGIAFDPKGRWSDHAREKEWWPAVAERTVEWHDTRVAAAAAEIVAIRTEKPLHNVRDTEVERAKRAAHAAGAKIGRMVRISDDLWGMYLDLCAEEGTTCADDLRRHVFSRVNTWRKKQATQAAIERRLKKLDDSGS